jgi:hypothetical protein
MRIGSAFTFVGRPATFSHTPTAGGTFKLGVNDCDATPNSGFFDAPVKINRPAFSVNSVAVPENQATLTFTVTLDLAPPAGVTASVGYTVASGTATLGDRLHDRLAHRHPELHAGADHQDRFPSQSPTTPRSS